MSGIIRPLHTDICAYGSYVNVVGISSYGTEEGILEKLGEPSNVSVNKDGTKKLITYPKWNASYEIEKDAVNELCVTSREKMRYAEEYIQPSKIEE